MRSARLAILRVAIAVGVAVGIGAPAALAGTSPVPSGEATYPHVTPRVAGRHRTFELSFTLAQAPGRRGTEETAYRAAVSVPAGARSSCAPTQPQPIATGTQGEVERIALHPPTRGWCRGQYAVTVYLQRTDVCGPPVGMSPDIIVCPQFATGVKSAFPTGEITTGTAHFTVRVAS